MEDQIDNSEFFCKEIIHRYPEWAAEYIKAHQTGASVVKAVYYHLLMKEVLKMSGGAGFKSIEENLIKMLTNK